MSTSTSTTSSTSSTAPRAKTPDWRTVFNTARKPGGQLLDLATRTGERVKFQNEPCGGTASWRWDATSRKRGHKPGNHVVNLDPMFALTLDRVSKPSRRLRLAYGTALLRHEKWHGLVTARDLDELAKEADKLGVPFPLLNLCEDLRIEHKARVAEGDCFMWCEYNLHPFRVASSRSEPLAWLAAYIRAECSTHPNGTKLIDGYWNGEPMTARVCSGVSEASKPTEDVLRTFAEQFATAATTWDVLRLAKDWMDTFPTAKQNPQDVPGMPSRYGAGYTPSNKGTGSTGTPMDYNGKPFDTVDPSKLPPVEQRRLEFFLDSSLDTLRLPDDEFARRAGHKLPDMSQSRGIARRLAQMLGSVDSARVRTATSGSRVHVRGVMTGDPSSFRQAEQRGGKRRVVAVFDQSGSMQGDWRRHGAAFAAALLLLHRQGVLDVQLILTGGRSHCVVPPTLNPSLLGRFPCQMGCESVDATLGAHKAALQAADTVLIYTDGNLTDGDVDAGRWRSLGVDLVGCAVGNQHTHNSLVRHFSRGITADTGAQLATRIVQYIATRK